MEQTPPLNPPYPQGPRKRGRPRKCPRQDGEGEGHVPVRPRWEWNTAGVPPPPTPPAFAKMPGSMLGRPVVGVVEALFDAGFLICVRADGSDYLYKGIVFRVGHYNPVTEENDIAPDVPMIQRVEFPIPDFPVVPGSDLGSRVKNEQFQISHGEKAAGLSNGSKGKEGALVAAQSAPHGSKGIEIASVAAQSAPHGSKGRDVASVAAQSAPLGSEGREVASVATQSAPHGSEGREVALVAAQSAPHGSKGREVASAAAQGLKGREVVSVAADSASRGSKRREVASVAAQSALHGSKAREVASVAAQSALHGSKAREVASVAAPTARPEIPRGTMVPVMLERTTIPNKVPLAIEPTPYTTPAAHLAASKGKVVQAAKPVPTIRIKKVLPHEQPIQPVLPRAQASEHVVPPRVPPSQSSVPTQREHSNPHVPTPAHHSPQPALIPPLPSSKSLEGERTKKMALLLQVVQETVQQGQVPEAEECSRASLKSSGTMTIKPDPEA